MYSGMLIRFSVELIQLVLWEPLLSPSLYRLVAARASTIGASPLKLYSGGKYSRTRFELFRSKRVGVGWKVEARLAAVNFT